MYRVASAAFTCRIHYALQFFFSIFAFDLDSYVLYARAFNTNGLLIGSRCGIDCLLCFEVAVIRASSSRILTNGFIKSLSHGLVSIGCYVISNIGHASGLPPEWLSTSSLVRLWHAVSTRFCVVTALYCDDVRRCVVLQRRSALNLAATLICALTTITLFSGCKWLSTNGRTSQRNRSRNRRYSTTWLSLHRWFVDVASSQTGQYL